uniref:Centrosomal protein 192 n=1 Tax=Bos mutus grunniens TaxID=30521 RepID=A0A8B9XSA9_BOSMU
MEDFRGIAEESFPSFLTSSLLGNSGILENVTLSSNLGLPVAVSTLARNRSSSENRYSDVQTSYLVEGKFSVPSETSPSSQSEDEPRERLRLVFSDDDSLAKKKNQTENQCLSDAVLRESAFPSDGARAEEEQARAAEPFLNQGPSNRASPLGQEQDDDIDDEEFYDDHLEAYFEQLAIPGMMYEDLEGQEPPENYFKLPTSDPSQVFSSLYGGESGSRCEQGGLLWLLSLEMAASPMTSLGLPFLESGRAEVLVKSLRTPNTKLNPVDFNDTNASKDDFDLMDSLKLEEVSPHQNKHLTSDSETVLPVDRFLDTETPQVSIQTNVDVASLKPVSDNAFNSTDAPWSPTSERQTCECYELVGKTKDQADPPQSVVYQDEEGRWVTDLAYYTPFDKEQDFNVSLSNELSEDFRSGSDALDLIAQDEEEFNKEHQFMQEENIDAQNMSVALGDTSWGTSVNCGLLRRSLSASDVDRDDASYLRLSLGEFFAQRSEALGCLGGGYNVKRPSFGYFIRSPEKREPIALIRKSDLSRSNLGKEVADLNHGLFSGDLKAQLSEGSVTLQAEELESISQVDENDVTLTANKGKAEDTFLVSSKPQRHTDELPSESDSVLRISTIASAIAEASVSADPLQLATMIKALSNKTREKTCQEDGKQRHYSAVSHFLPNDLEKSNGSSTFDMERYLKKTDISQYEGGLDNFSRAGVSGIWDLSLSKERTTHDIHVVDLGATSISVREPEVGTAAKLHGMFCFVFFFCVLIGKYIFLIDLKSPSPERGGQGSENGEDSFRPSTSPLSHSSPSEISGTSLSGCALESFGSAAQPQKGPCERELSQLTCPEASVSRLTYVSEQESISPSMASRRVLDDRKSDITSELSTTIIRASPVPAQEPAADKLGEKSPFQSRGKGALSYIIQKNLDTEKVTETTSLSSRPEDVKLDFSSSRLPSSKSEDRSQTSATGLTSDRGDLEQVSLALRSESSLHPATLAIPCLPVSRQAPVLDGGHVTPRDTSATDSEFSGQGPYRTSVPSVPSTEGCGPAPMRQHMPLTGPAVSVHYPLPVAPCAQPHSGALPAASSATLPRCRACGATACGLSCGLPGSCHPAIVGEHVQHSVTAGLCLGQDIGSGLMASSSLCNLYSDTLSQNLLNAAKVLPVQSLHPDCGIEPWDSAVVSGLGRVSVPEELKFPHACCVGIASQTYLSVLNPADRWLQVSIGVLSVSVDGEKVDFSAYPCLVFKNRVIIRPHATEEIKVLFIPSDPGIFRCIFSVASWPFSADAETVAQAEALASRVVLTAIAETPMIEVETEKKGVLDFGDLTYGSWKALPLKLVNKTHANIPIRLIISANAVAWRCFTFSKEPIHAALRALPYAHAIAQLAAPSVINHMMPASDDGQDPEFLVIWVLFHSPKKQITSSEILDSAEEFLARVDIEVDSPNPTPVIKSISLRARTGIARIHAPKDLQTLHLFASVASSARQYLPLKNAGNIDVHLDIKIPDQGSHFSVDPEKLFLKPGEEHEVIVSFSPKDPVGCEERILKIFVQPFGPQYEVMLKGEIVSSGNRPLAPESLTSDIPSILSNKQFLAWGGVPLGRTQLQKLALRNNSASTAQHLRLLVRGQDQDCFQLQHTFGSEERLTSNCEVRIHSKEDIYISVLFAPTRLSFRSQPGVKFTIPLSGYGGTSNLILEDVKKLSDSYMVTVNDLVPGQESRIVISVRNTGSRAAFVKAVGFKDSQKKVLLDPKVLRIFPDKFVLKERTQEDVTIIYNPSDRESSCKTTTELSTIYFFGGDEISRQQYRRAVLHMPEVRERILPSLSVLHSIDFAEAFQDELLVTEVYDLPQQPNDVQLFYGNMRKIILSVIGEFRDSISSREFLPPSAKPSLEFKSCGAHGGNISLDVLPVKGPQGSPLLSQAVPPPQDNSASEEVWAVHPEHLVLVAPSCDMAKTGRFQILNNSIRLLKFELYWPAHCLTVTPQHGFIAPESKMQILVSPNSSLSTKHSMFPWSGLIYIHCDNGQKKIVKVQIREDLTQEELFTHLTSGPLGILSQETEHVVNLVKPAAKPPSTKVELRNKTVTFPPTEPGETSGNYLELENHGDTEVRWHLSSLAPPYVKGVDESGDVFRATYAAFRCSPISGVVEGHSVQKVSIMFLPRDRGDYAQFWDVECHPLKEPHLKHTLRFQLSGHSVRAESEPGISRISANSLIKIDNLLKLRRQAVSEASALIPGQLDLTHRGVYAPEDVYQFLPTKVGESRTLKVNLRNNSFITHSLKFLSPREPFYVKHSKYSLRAQHYINMPVQFKPKSVGKFEALLVVQTDEGKSVAVRLIGEALGNIS